MRKPRTRKCGLDLVDEHMPDWEAIRKQLEEHGKGSLSYEEFAKEHGVSKTTLLRRIQKWTGPVRTGKSGPDRSEVDREHFSPIHVLRSELPSPPSAVKGANLVVEDLVEILEEKRKNKAKLEIADYLKVANALSQCNRIIINTPAETEEEDQEDFSGFSEDELRQYAEYQERAKKRA